MEALSFQLLERRECVAVGRDEIANTAAFSFPVFLSTSRSIQLSWRCKSKLSGSNSSIPRVGQWGKYFKHGNAPFKQPLTSRAIPGGYSNTNMLA